MSCKIKCEYYRKQVELNSLVIIIILYFLVTRPSFLVTIFT